MNVYLLFSPFALKMFTERNKLIRKVTLFQMCLGMLRISMHKAKRNMYTDSSMKAERTVLHYNFFY